MQFTNIDLDQSLGEMFGFRRLEGKGNLSFAIDSSGDSVYELTRGLNGTATLVSRKGVISGINVEQLLKRMERSPLSRGNEFRTGKTPYDTLTASLKIARGTATVEDIRVDGPTVRLGLIGSASIPDRDLDLRGTASLVSSAPPAFELPFMVQGAWDDPVMLPDAQSLIQRSGAAQPLLDALRKSTARDAIRSAIEKLGIAAPAAKPPATETAAQPATAEYAPAATESLPTAEPKPEHKPGEAPEPAQ
jgi:AsmA protein